MPPKIKQVFKAEILTIGSEITRGRIVNTNSAFISKALSHLGFDVEFHTACPDARKTMRQAMVLAAKRSHLVVITGGLGPTEDDLTTEVITEMLGNGAVYCKSAVDRVLQILKDSKKVATPAHLRMASLPKGATHLHNATGMAAGYYFRYNRCVFAVMPGVPREMKAMFEGEVVPMLRQHFFKLRSPAPYFAKTFRVLGIAESQVSRAVRGLKLPEKFPGVEVAYQVPFPYVLLVLETKGDEQNLKAASTAVRNLLGQAIVAEDNETPASHLQKVPGTPGTPGTKIGHHTIAVAESCTGGMLAAEITAEAGASKYFLGGVVCYSNESKVRDLAVSEEILRQHGAVSQATACAMAQGVRRRFSADLALAITGIAGPEGGSAEKPVGTVWMAVATATTINAHHFLFKGDREMVRQAAVAWGLRLLRDGVTGG